jgi:DNA/RNA endonuclease G (NUC1)
LSGISAAPGKELYISGRAGGKEEQHRLKQKISVLAKTWKVIAVLDRQGLGLQGVTANTSEAIPVMMPNDSRVQGKEWKSFRVSVKQVERERGLNFLSNVSPQVQ